MALKASCQWKMIHHNHPTSSNQPTFFGGISLGLPGRERLKWPRCGWSGPGATRRWKVSMSWWTKWAAGRKWEGWDASFGGRKDQYEMYEMYETYVTYDVYIMLWNAMICSETHSNTIFGTFRDEQPMNEKTIYFKLNRRTGFWPVPMWEWMAGWKMQI